MRGQDIIIMSVTLLASFMTIFVVTVWPPLTLTRILRLTIHDSTYPYHYGQLLHCDHCHHGHHSHQLPPLNIRFLLEHANDQSRVGVECGTTCNASLQSPIDNGYLCKYSLWTTRGRYVRFQHLIFLERISEWTNWHSERAGYEELCETEMINKCQVLSIC